MHSLHYLSLHSKPTPWLQSSSPFSNEPAISFTNSQTLVGRGKAHPAIPSLSSCIVYAVDKDSQQFDVDPDKAREALKNLDQQLQSLAEKKVRPPKIKATDLNLNREERGEEVTEFSTSFLAYTAGALFLFTIFYNVLFITVIKPSIDGPDEPPAEALVRDFQK
ncbi:hypothetical protein FNV43_RR02961 [Rhamnella rubrinervis]|uniref:Uncharacterized protein n=1 Tax=Rhamnella rubrinervis TaxID=2594499 RepID=A0A8K0MNU5_9ROSA|nr:hypothetical protein FNV43_RR02961 [Rhamnella rubrinervis]